MSMSKTRPQLLCHLTVGGALGLQLQHCIDRLAESGLSYLDDFDHAQYDISKLVPAHGVVKLHSMPLNGTNKIKFAHHLQAPEHGKPLLLGHVVMQLAHALARQHQAAVYSATVKAQLKGRQLTEDEARKKAELPEMHDIFITGIARWNFGHEEMWYPEIRFPPRMHACS